MCFCKKSTPDVDNYYARFKSVRGKDTIESWRVFDVPKGYPVANQITINASALERDGCTEVDLIELRKL